MKVNTSLIIQLHIIQIATPPVTFSQWWSQSSPTADSSLYPCSILWMHSLFQSYPDASDALHRMPLQDTSHRQSAKNTYPIFTSAIGGSTSKCVSNLYLSRISSYIEFHSTPPLRRCMYIPLENLNCCQWWCIQAKKWYGYWTECTYKKGSNSSKQWSTLATEHEDSVTVSLCCRWIGGICHSESRWICWTIVTISIGVIIHQFDLSLEYPPVSIKNT